MLKPTPRHPHGQRGEQQGGETNAMLLAPGASRSRRLPQHRTRLPSPKPAQAPQRAVGCRDPNQHQHRSLRNVAGRGIKPPLPPKKTTNSKTSALGDARGSPAAQGGGGGGVRVAQRGSHLLSCHGEAGTALPCAGAESEEGVHAQEAHGGEEVERDAEADVQAGEAQSQHPQPGAPP